jgi:hypothetical protein
MSEMTDQGKSPGKFNTLIQTAVTGHIQSSLHPHTGPGALRETVSLTVYCTWKIELKGAE